MNAEEPVTSSVRRALLIGFDEANGEWREGIVRSLSCRNFRHIQHLSDLKCLSTIESAMTWLLSALNPGDIALLYIRGNRLHADQVIFTEENHCSLSLFDPPSTLIGVQYHLIYDMTIPRDIYTSLSTCNGRDVVQAQALPTLHRNRSEAIFIYLRDPGALFQQDQFDASVNKKNHKSHTSVLTYWLSLINKNDLDGFSLPIASVLHISNASNLFPKYVVKFLPQFHPWKVGFLSHRPVKPPGKLRPEGYGIPEKGVTKGRMNSTAARIHASTHIESDNFRTGRNGKIPWASVESGKNYPEEAADLLLHHPVRKRCTTWDNRT